MYEKSKNISISNNKMMDRREAVVSSFTIHALDSKTDFLERSNNKMHKAARSGAT